MYIQLHNSVYSMNTHSIQLSYENGTEDFTGGPVVKNPPSNAGNTGSIPSGGTKTPHESEQLSPQLQPERNLPTTMTQPRKFASHN